MAEAPAIGPILSLYNLLIEAKVSVFFLTGRGENKRNITEQNLRQEGYTGWTDLILRYCYVWLYSSFFYKYNIEEEKFLVQIKQHGEEVSITKSLHHYNIK